MSIGIWQIVLILAIVLILFGAGKLPRVMGDVAKGIKNFKTGMKEEEGTEESGNDETVSVSKEKDNNTDSKTS
jgi:sec-independent protein translocase protein TatA|tara:strand:+ start:178 stop:396 length:219 start_codon:yes stop_codon:yes gene_type:complete